MDIEDSLDGNLIQSILEACSNEASISEMLNAGASYHTIKKCLFYLIEFGMIYYNGEKRVYYINMKDGTYYRILTQQKKR
jgi:predicted transcriptional regulator